MPGGGEYKRLDDEYFDTHVWQGETMEPNGLGCADRNSLIFVITFFCHHEKDISPTRDLLFACLAAEGRKTITSGAERAPRVGTGHGTSEGLLQPSQRFRWQHIHAAVRPGIQRQAQ